MSSDSATPRRAAKSKAGLWAASFLIPAVLCSCGEKRVEVFPLSGKISVDGQPAPGAQVVLAPRGHQLPPNSAASAKAAEDGTFKVRLYGDQEGVPAGDYVVAVTWNKVVATSGGSGAGPNVLPARYSKPDTSDLTVTVKPGPNDPLTLDLKTK